MSTEDRLVMKN